MSQEGLGPSQEGLEASLEALAGPETNPFHKAPRPVNPGLNTRIWSYLARLGPLGSTTAQ